MQTPEVFVVKGSDLLFEAVAARLVTHLVDHIYARGAAVLLLQSDPLIESLFEALLRGPLRSVVDWSHVSVWWANTSGTDAAAHEQLLALGVTADNLHAITTTDGSDLTTAAGSYARELRAARRLDDHGEVPAFDIALLVVGSDGGVAGLLPERPTVHDEGAVAVDQRAGVITLTGTAMSAAREVWLLASGPVPAAGVHLALTGGPLQVPAAGARGQARTLVILDDAAAKALPSSLRRFASP